MFEKGKSTSFVVTLIESKIKKGISTEIPVYMPQLTTPEEVVSNFEEKGIQVSFSRQIRDLYHFSVV